MAHDGPGPAWPTYEPPRRGHGAQEPEPEPGSERGRRRRRTVLAGVAAVLLAAGGVTVAAVHDDAPQPSPPPIISAQGYAALLAVLRSGPGTQVTSVYLDDNIAQVHVVTDAAHDEMWSYTTDGGLALQATSRAVDARRPFDAATFDGGRLARLCAATAQDIGSTPARCAVDIAPIDRDAHPSWVELDFGSYTAYFTRTLHPDYAAGG
ncbi:hypothetical protein GCM10028801_04090 [Nocardioides maradonensis]